MIYIEKPKNFNPKFEVVSCFIEYHGKILLLHRQDFKPQGNTWGLPTGKVEGNEKLSEAMAREIREETSFDIPDSELKYFKKVYVMYPDYEFIYHIFSTKLKIQKKVLINSKEHKDFKWTSPKNSLKMSLIGDLDKCIKLFYKISLLPKF